MIKKFTDVYYGNECRFVDTIKICNKTSVWHEILSYLMSPDGVLKIYEVRCAADENDNSTNAVDLSPSFLVRPCTRGFTEFISISCRFSTLFDGYRGYVWQCCILLLRPNPSLCLNKIRVRFPLSECNKFLFCIFSLFRSHIPYFRYFSVVYPVFFQKFTENLPVSRLNKINLQVFVTVLPRI